MSPHLLTCVLSQYTYLLFGINFVFGIQGFRVVLEKQQCKMRLNIFVACDTAYTFQCIIVCCIAEPTCHLPAVSKVLPSFRESPSGRLMRQDPVVHLSPNKQGHVSYPKKGIMLCIAFAPETLNTKSVIQSIFNVT